MAPFYPVYLVRSDGKLECSKNASIKSAKEPNEPLPEQLVKEANEKGFYDYFRPCEPGHSKETDWRRKLAGMLIREIGEQEDQGQRSRAARLATIIDIKQDKNYILASLPENYRLFEHIRYKAAITKENSLKKAHAGGGHERQDAYLYGHPQGRKKRYRSPAEFFPHLLWLATDETGDPNKCSCRICSPEEIEVEKEPETKFKQTAAATKLASKASSESSEPAKSAAKSQASAPLQSLLPRVRNAEQKWDLEYNKFLYRPGEVVWYQRGQAWGLGTVVQRIHKPNQTPKFQYRVQPLSQPLAAPSIVLCPQEQLRNWLAWSPPPCMHADLNPSAKNNWKIPTYDSVDWKVHVTHRSNGQDADVDGSILAAKAVEMKYSVFELLEAKTSTLSSSHLSEKCYNGMYIGAEKVWLGDVLRLRNANSEILFLHKITEKQHLNDASRTVIELKGDVYSPASATHGSPFIPKSQENLPIRVREDMAARNAIFASSPDAARKNQTHFWQLTSKDATFGLSDVKGRWYESSIMMPILAKQDYEVMKQRGELADASLYMNGHGDCNRPVPVSADRPFRAAWLRVKKREDSFGQAVPAGFKIGATLEDLSVVTPASAYAGAPRVQAVTQQQQQQKPKANVSAIINRPTSHSAGQSQNTPYSQVQSQTQPQVQSYQQQNLQTQQQRSAYDVYGPQRSQFQNQNQNDQPPQNQNPPSQQSQLLLEMMPPGDDVGMGIDGAADMAFDELMDFEGNEIVEDEMRF